MSFGCSRAPNHLQLQSQLNFPLLQDLGDDGFSVSKGLNELESGQHGLLDESELAAAEEKESHSFEIDPSKVASIIF